MFKEENKEIIVLSEKDHIRQKPTVYVGSVKESEEKIPIIKNGKIYIESFNISVGLYKLFDEVFSNSLDEAKRMNGKMKTITIRVESGANRMTIRDTGNGFYKGTEVNKVSGKSNIETAFSELRAGSNFKNEQHSIEESLVGTNGMGVSLVNVLSKKFKIVTVNDKNYYEQEWDDYNVYPPIVKKNKGEYEKGTEVSFQPLCSVFSPCKWNKEILTSIIALKNDIIKKDPTISKLNIKFFWDDIEIKMPSRIFTEDSYLIETPIGQIAVWEKYEGSGSISFINSAMCTGIHQKMFNDYINEKLEDTLGHHFYDTYITLNLPPKVVKFGDQNKTRFVSQRDEISSYIDRNFGNKIQSFFKSPIFEAIRKKVEERRNEGYVKKLKAERRKIDMKKSHKYFPASKNTADNLFLVEGDSAKGSILQKRSPDKDGVYALKGKIKNCRTIGDLSDNREILELMHILSIDPMIKTSTISGYKRVVIAADADPDGAHITSLIINLFHRWFPQVIKSGQLMILRTPLVSVGDGKRRKYFGDLEEFKKVQKSQSGSIRYLKGLGSLDPADWEFVMANKELVAIDNSPEDDKYLEMAFGTDSSLRKKWLGGIE